MGRRFIMNTEKVDKHKEKLIRAVADEVTALFEKVLDYAEVAVPNSEQYKKLRSKILRIGNNCRRNIAKEITNHYSVTYIAPGEVVIEVVNKPRAMAKGSKN